MSKVFKSNLQHRAVARAIALWRMESGLSLSEVTKLVNWSAAKTSMMQNGLIPIADADVMALALAYGIDEIRRAPVFWGSQRARDPRRFDLVTSDQVSCVNWTYSEVEAEASYVRIVALDVLPPLVWTPEYSAAIRRENLEELSVRGCRSYDDLHRAQMRRRLEEGPGLRVDLVVGQAILRRPVGGALVMADQLFQLALFAQLPGVRVFLAPDSGGAIEGMHSFTLLSFRQPEFDDVVYLDCPHDGVWLEGDAERERCLEVFDWLMSVALVEADTLELVYSAAQDFKDAER